MAIIAELRVKADDSALGDTFAGAVQEQKVTLVFSLLN